MTAKSFANIYIIFEINKFFEVFLGFEMDETFVDMSNVRLDAMDSEQKILSEHKSNRIKVKYGSFETTEAFNINIFNNYESDIKSFII